MNRIINRRDLDFQLYELFDLEGLSAFPRFQDHDKASYQTAIDAAERLALEKFLPHAAKSDENEPQIKDGKVSLIPEIKEALDAYIAGGFHLAHVDEAEGGMQVPHMVSQAIAALFTGANASTAAYAFLSNAAANLLDAYGSDDQKERFLKPMREGRYFGTMCLSEPQAGSSLADIKTTATKKPDGSYAIRGTKMWISAGDHDLTDNIVHLVLARCSDAPKGVKGLSLFIVPKFKVSANGGEAASNDVSLVGLNHKMGYRGTTNCVLNFGEAGSCEGSIIGEPGQGLAIMFHMMNEARIGVGLGATMLGTHGYLYSLHYAKERLQGRPAGSSDPDHSPVPIIEHADVRRMLLTQKVYVEGALSLCLYCARLLDLSQNSPDQVEKDRASALLDVLTPIAKAWPSEYGVKANDLAIQILGGYGYSREYPVERLYRDNRLNPIHEGTNGIQSLDLLGRKVLLNEGASFRLIMEEIGKAIGEAMEHKILADLGAAMQGAVELLSRVTVRLVTTAHEGDQTRFLANSHTYLQMTGHIVIAHLWLRQASIAAKNLDTATGDELDFYMGKIMAARFFFTSELPATGPMASFLASLDTTVLDIPDAGF